MSRLVPLLIAAALALLVWAVPASAGPPPAGKYECTISGEYFGELKIKQGGKYERNGISGKFTNPKGRVLKFTSGSFKGFNGRWQMANEGGGKVPEIAVRNPHDDFEDIYCSK